MRWPSPRKTLGTSNSPGSVWRSRHNPDPDVGEIIFITLIQLLCNGSVIMVRISTINHGPLDPNYADDLIPKYLNLGENEVNVR